LDLEAADARHAQIEDQAGRQVAPRAIEERWCGLERFGVDSVSAKEAPERTEDSRVIVDDEDACCTL
jgi:hypothetical protein